MSPHWEAMKSRIVCGTKDSLSVSGIFSFNLQLQICIFKGQF